ncbi:uncharacterized protein TNCV_2841901 [Trichonephila clavipes]|uniref:Uncharacterized protein n=1 Tax=Trichonephila clavipes TaxID=2585209 RepID=A0A8X6RNW6_TRICX|nr:uncharacterized protein TNCV_2841901 [Trichonephila clavipes]
MHALYSRLIAGDSELRSRATCAVTSTHITIILESLPKPGDDTLGDSKFLGYFQLATSTFRAVGSLVVRASDSRPEGLGSMPDATKHPPSTHGSRCRNCGGGDRGRVAIYRPFGELRRAKNRTVTCMVLKANDRRTSSPCHDEFRGPRSD